MSWSSSYLSSPKYGYDIVVGVTQASINATMKLYLSKLKQPVVSVCYVADDNGSPTLIDYKELLSRANNSDPFKIPADADPDTNPDIQNLTAAGFMAGFQARVGLPPGYDPRHIPDLVVLGSDTSAVTFNMLCSQFDIVENKPKGGFVKHGVWNRMSQPSGAAWIIQSKVDLRMSPVASSAYNSLPENVQMAIKNIGADAFSVQQLLFDLSNAQLQSIPNIIGVTPGPGVYQMLQDYFMSAYFTEMAKEGQPVLGVTVTHKNGNWQEPSLKISNLNLQVSPYVGSDGQPVPNPSADQQRLATLNYLCATDGHNLPAAVPFSWNWIESNEQGDYHGVAVTKRETLANYFEQTLTQHALANCYKPDVTVVYCDGLMVCFDIHMPPGKSLKVTKPASGATVLSLSYNSRDDLDGKISYDEAGLNGASGWAKGWSTYSLDLSFSGSTIVVRQHLNVHYEASNFIETAGGEAVDKTITSTYPLAMTADGGLTLGTPTTKTDDNATLQHASGAAQFFTNLNNILDHVVDKARSLVAPALDALPLSIGQNYVFPGGNTFAFKSVAFSDNGDLVTHITYVDPS